MILDFFFRLFGICVNIPIRQTSSFAVQLHWQIDRGR